MVGYIPTIAKKEEEIKQETVSKREYDNLLASQKDLVEKLVAENLANGRVEKREILLDTYTTGRFMSHYFLGYLDVYIN